MPSIITLNAVTNSTDLQNNTQLTNRTVYASALRGWVRSSSFAGNFANNSIPSSRLQLVQGDRIAPASLSGSNFFNGQIAKLSITDNDIATGTITVQKLNATGTRNSTTFLRGDGAWANVTSPTAGSGISITSSGSSATISVVYTTQSEVEGANPPTDKSVSAKVLSDVLGLGGASGGFVTLLTNQTIGGVKTIQNALILSTEGTQTTHAVRADRTISVGDGLTGGGNLTQNRVISVDSTVVRTSGNQTIDGTKTFSSTIAGSINGNAATVTNGVYTSGNQTINGILTLNGVSVNQNNITITNTSPTITLQDTNHRSGFIHVNSNLFYILRGDVNGTTWDAGPNNRHPMTLNLNNGDVVFSGNVTAFSDKRLKTNIATISNALEKTISLRGVTFERKETRDKCIGVVAQEVREIVPEAVIEDKEGYLSVSYGNLVGLLIESIKELNSKVKDLELKLNS